MRSPALRPGWPTWTTRRRSAVPDRGCRTPRSPDHRTRAPGPDRIPGSRRPARGTRGRGTPGEGPACLLPGGRDRPTGRGARRWRVRRSRRRPMLPDRKRHGPLPRGRGPGRRGRGPAPSPDLYWKNRRSVRTESRWGRVSASAPDGRRSWPRNPEGASGPQTATTRNLVQEAGVGQPAAPQSPAGPTLHVDMVCTGSLSSGAVWSRGAICPPVSRRRHDGS